MRRPVKPSNRSNSSFRSPSGTASKSAAGRSSLWASVHSRSLAHLHYLLVLKSSSWSFHAGRTVAIPVASRTWVLSPDSDPSASRTGALSRMWPQLMPSNLTTSPNVNGGFPRESRCRSRQSRPSSRGKGGRRTQATRYSRIGTAPRPRSSPGEDDPRLASPFRRGASRHARTGPWAGSAACPHGL